MMEIFKTKDEMFDKASSDVLSFLENIVEAKGNADVLLSGGSTPGPLYVRIDYQCEYLNKINFALIDERFVPTNNLYSNELFVRNCFQNNENNYYSIMGMVFDEKNPKNNLKILNKKYKKFIQNTDLIILGMGKDGHIASIFPEDISSRSALNSSDSFFNTISPSMPNMRITASLNFICKAKKIILLIIGNEKKKVLTDENKNLPIHLLLSKRNDINIYYTDHG